MQLSSRHRYERQNTEIWERLLDHVPYIKGMKKQDPKYVIRQKLNDLHLNELTGDDGREIGALALQDMRPEVAEALGSTLLRNPSFVGPKKVQRAINFINQSEGWEESLVEDGHIGPKTVAALWRINNGDSEDVVEFVKQVTANNPFVSRFLEHDPDHAEPVIQLTQAGHDRVMEEQARRAAPPPRTSEGISDDIEESRGTVKEKKSLEEKEEAEAKRYQAFEAIAPAIPGRTNEEGWILVTQEQMDQHKKKLGFHTKREGFTERIKGSILDRGASFFGQNIGHLNSAEIGGLIYDPGIMDSLDGEKVAREAAAKSKERFPEFKDQRRNNIRDAWRHAYFSISMAEHECIDKYGNGIDEARDILNNHEKTVGNPEEELFMDIHNNNMGLLISKNADFKGFSAEERADWLLENGFLITEPPIIVDQKTYDAITHNTELQPGK